MDGRGQNLYLHTWLGLLLLFSLFLLFRFAGGRLLFSVGLSRWSFFLSFLSSFPLPNSPLLHLQTLRQGGRGAGNWNISFIFTLFYLVRRPRGVQKWLMEKLLREPEKGEFYLCVCSLAVIIPL